MMTLDHIPGLDHPCQKSRDELIEVLHAVQKQYGYLSTEALASVAENMRLPSSLVYGVASFYHLFRLKPQGRHHCTVCTGTSCHLKGGSQALLYLEDRLGLLRGETSADGAVSLATVRCLGVCGKAPLALCDETMISGSDGDDLTEKVLLQLRQVDR